MSSLCFKRISVHPGFVFTIAAFLFAESSVYSSAVLLCATLHEVGHLLAIKATHTSFERIELLPFGVNIRYSKEPSYKKEMFIAISGPCASFLTAVTVFLIFFLHPNRFLLFFAVCSFFLGIVNLIPVRSFDGGRFLRCALLCSFEYEKALKIIHTSELLSLLLLSAFSVYAVIFAGYNLSLCAVCIYLFVSVYRHDY